MWQPGFVASACLLNKIEQLVLWLEQVRETLFVRLPKTKRWSRLSGLMNTLAGWWCEARNVCAADWEQAQRQWFVFGRQEPKRSSTDAAFEQAARAEAAILDGGHAVSMRADLAKFFETVTLSGADHEPALARSVVVSCHAWWHAGLRQP